MPRSPASRAGRPRSQPASPGARFYVVSARLTPALLARVDAVCARTQKSRNEVVRNLLGQGLAAEEQHRLADALTDPALASRAASEVGLPEPGDRGGAAAPTAAA